MSKPNKNKKDRVPKITEEEYMEYLCSLREIPNGLELQEGAEKAARKSVISEE